MLKIAVLSAQEVRKLYCTVTIALLQHVSLTKLESLEVLLALFVRFAFRDNWEFSG